jgi:hypothetical protein
MQAHVGVTYYLVISVSFQNACMHDYGIRMMFDDHIGRVGSSVRPDVFNALVET